MANNLVAGQVDTNNATDVFLHDRATGTNALVSHVAASAVQATLYGGSQPSMSADGRWIAFASRAANVVAGQIDTNSGLDVFLYDRTTGTSVVASHIPSSAVQTGNGYASAPALSRDGSRVAWSPRTSTTRGTSSSTATRRWPTSRSRRPTAPPLARPARR
jgi:Tol biopolymer transport system component